MQLSLQQAMELAARHLQAAQFQEAESIVRQILGAEPNHADAMNLLAVALAQTGRIDEAIDWLSKAVAIAPRSGEYQANLGQALLTRGRPIDAIAPLRTATTLKPERAAGHYNLGNALRAAGRFDQAIESYRRAIQLNPDFVDAQIHLGNSFQQCRQYEQAIAIYRQALTLNPSRAEIHFNLGGALQSCNLFDEAADAYRQALSLNPNFAVAQNNLGSIHLARTQLDEAIDSFRRATVIQPDYAAAHTNLAMTMLLKGDFENGWPEYEWRTRSPELAEYCQQFPQPRWDGQSLDGRTLLLHAEQGAGDAIQFARYIPRVLGFGGRVIVQCQPSLVRLLRSIPGNFEIVSTHAPLPHFDVHCPLLSLAGVFKTDLQSIPADVPYLFPDSSDVDRWRERLAGHRQNLKIGLAWAGRETHENDRNRSMTLDALATLFDVPGASFISLQKHANEVPPMPSAAPPGKLIDWTTELSDFADTAALMGNLDLIITVDTSIAHLAGAVGKPVWVLLPFIPDWRWLLDRDDSPWYPTMRLFRQPRHGGWNAPVASIVERLMQQPPGVEPVDR